MATFRLIGWSEFEAQLQELDASLQRKGLIEVADAAADILVDAARAIAPRSKDGSHMADRIKKRVSSKDNGIHRVTVDVGPDAKDFHALFVEKGTRERFYKKGRKGSSSGVMPAHPFMAPAFDANVDRMTQAIQEKMQDIIDRVTA